MSNKDQKNIDGFMLRRRPVSQGASTRLGVDNLSVPDHFKRSTEAHDIQLPNARSPYQEAAVSTNIGAVSRSDIDDSLAAIDMSTEEQVRRKKRISRKMLKRLFISIAVILFLVGAGIGIKFLIAGSNVFSGNLFGLLGAGKELKADQYGRTNILVFGNSEDSVAHTEEGLGAELTDSIMVISIDQKAKNAVMFSIPRDLWVKYGEACQSGFEGRINVVYECGKDGASQKDGAEKLMQVVGESFGLDIQYYSQVNYGALRDAVNAVGGITVQIDSDDPRGVLDRNFDWQCGFKCNLVKWPNGPADLNGEQALALARARNAAGGYGLGGGNFDREQYQQKILVALKDKAASAGTLANPIAVTGLIDTLGNNVKTNFDTAEIKTLVSLANEVNQQSIKRLSLVDPEAPIMTTGNIDGQSIVRPVEGIYDFSEVQRYIRSQLSNDPGANEDASVEVLNGTDTAGVAGDKAEELSTKGVIISSTGDAPTSSSYGALQWFDLSGGQKPKTTQKLTEVLGEGSSGSELPDGVQSDADFVIIIGDGSN